MIVALHSISDIASGRRKSKFTESQLVRGYLLASLGRSLLHGDTSRTSEQLLIEDWQLRTNDFIAIQNAYLQLYVGSFGALYTKQLDHFIPLAFPPSFEVHAKKKWSPFAYKLETVYTSLRNWMFTECQNLIDFGPYIPLVAFEEVRSSVSASSSRRVLIDVGANGFYASPKYILDAYSPFLPFTHAIMVEPEPHFSASVPDAYSQRYNISFLQVYNFKRRLIVLGSRVSIVTLFVYALCFCRFMLK
jgi:hypothetical protein